MNTGNLNADYYCTSWSQSCVQSLISAQRSTAQKGEMPHQWPTWKYEFKGMLLLKEFLL